MVVWVPISMPPCAATPNCFVLFFFPHIACVYFDFALRHFVGVLYMGFENLGYLGACF